MVTGLLVKHALSPKSDYSERESSLAIRIKCTQDATPDLVNGLIHGLLLQCPAVKPDVLSQQNEKAISEQIASW